VNPTERKITHVSAAVLIREDGSFLLAQRPAGKPYPGYWEFPGGKIEPDETPAQAIIREIKEELNIEVLDPQPWIVRQHVYEHATVLLRFFRITQWRGELRGLEGQAFTWQRLSELSVAPMLPANAPIFRALATPTTMLISNIAEEGEARWFTRAELNLRKLADRQGIDAVAPHRAFVQIREKQMSAAQINRVIEEAKRRLEPLGAIVLLNSDCKTSNMRFDDIHLTSATLRARHATQPIAQRGDALNRNHWLTAACHNSSELAQAVAAQCDAVTLSPVLATQTHPDAVPLGWAAFQQIIDTLSIPAFALGGQSEQSRSLAYAHGAHGVAMMRG
jgi:8-oxo-dGTP diphosphatase